VYQSGANTHGELNMPSRRTLAALARSNWNCDGEVGNVIAASEW